MKRDTRDDRITAVKDAPLARGKAEYLKWLEGGRLTNREAIYANCYLCMGYYLDGKADCKISLCPMHDLMPYNPKKTKREMTDEAKRASAERLKQGRIRRSATQFRSATK